MTAYKMPGVVVLRLKGDALLSKMTMVSLLDGYVPYLCGISEVCERHIPAHCLII
jgi:hypothetical protein